MANPLGGDFLKNLNVELEKLSRNAYDVARDPDPPAQPAPKKFLKGKPGSVERMQQAAQMVGDPALISELAWETIGTHLQNALHQIRHDEAADDFYEYDEPAYRPETVEAFTSAARMLAQVGDPQLYAAFEYELGEDSPLQEYLEPAVEFAETQGRIESYELSRIAEEKRLSEREQALNREYLDIERRTGPAGVAAADQLAQTLHADGLLYHPGADEDLVRAELRATAEQEKANRRGLSVGKFLSEFNEAAVRYGGPGSSWSDEEREKWEGELRQATVETVQRAFGDPADAADRAIGGMIEDDQRLKTGKGAFQRDLEAEIDRQYSHSRAGSPHLNAMNEAAVRDWEETHDNDGWPRVVQDGMGRESGGRYRQPGQDR
jgi:hypothetical protein